MSRVVHRIAVLTVLAAVVLLTLGGLTTSFRAGMADPVWPTEPWFLIVNGHKYQLEQHRGFLLEHTHRAAGFTVGGLASLLALAAWLSGPEKKKSRWYGVIAVVVLLVTYGWLHGQMTAAWNLRKQGLPFEWPHAAINATLAAACLLLVAIQLHLASRQPEKWVRFWASVLLMAVMVQGLLGGLRVFLDAQLGISQTLGVELAAVHGVFAQVVFAGLCCLAILCRPPAPARTVAPEERGRLLTLSVALVAAVFLQLIWAAWVRHTPTPLGQRLHILTAFVVLGVAVWLAMRISLGATSRRAFRWAAAHLLLMLALQILLGVEAWMGKFSAQGPNGALPPDLRPVTTHTAAIRTLHQLIGTAILASSAALALRVWRRPHPVENAVATEPAARRTNEEALGSPS